MARPGQSRPKRTQQRQPERTGAIGDGFLMPVPAEGTDPARRRAASSTLDFYERALMLAEREERRCDALPYHKARHVVSGPEGGWQCQSPQCKLK